MRTRRWPVLATLPPTVISHSAHVRAWTPEPLPRGSHQHPTCFAFETSLLESGFAADIPGQHISQDPGGWEPRKRLWLPAPPDGCRLVHRPGLGPREKSRHWFPLHRKDEKPMGQPWDQICIRF